MAAPAHGLRLADKQRLTEELLLSGAPISEINCVRKSLSAIKGGRLAAAARPARIATLIVSDIPGDEPGLVASGPTLPATHTMADAIAILSRCQIDIPARLSLPFDAHSEEHVRDAFDHDLVEIIASGGTSLLAAEKMAQSGGCNVVNLGAAIEGEAASVAREHAERLRDLAEGTFLLSGGETTVTVKPGRTRGKGGRNTEYLLALGLALENTASVHALACDTDGIDGNAEAAGAMLWPDSLNRMRQVGLDPKKLLQDHDSASAFEAIDGLIKTGPTGTNVNDFRCALISAGNGSFHPL
jgi:hydroxypyruvate reductase